MSQYFLSHPANTSTAGCLEEDQVFIRNAHEGNMTLVKSSTRSEVPYRVEGGARVALVWAAVEHLRLDLAISVFSRVLEGNHHEDLWFWRHGDEELTGAATLRSSPPWKEAANALQIRSSRQQAQTKLEQLELKQLVQSAAPELRVAMIYWLVMTSQAYKTATRKPGRRDEEEGGVLGGVRALVTRWWSSLPDGVQKWLSEHSQDYDRRAFDAGMVAKGHNCHVDDPEQHGFASDDPTRALRTWLFMRSRLYPLRKDNIFCLGYRRRWSSDKSDICPVYLSSALEPLPPWTPAPAVVALRHIWDRVADGRDFSKWIAIQDMSGFQEVENFIYRISSDFPSLEFRPWVNTYPQDIREAAASYTLEEWRTVAACVPLYPAATTIDKKKRFGTSVLKKITSALHPKLIFDIRACFAAMVWKMMLANMSTMEHVRKFVDIMGSFELIPRHTNHALETVCTSFYSEIKKLHHTCWSYNRIAEYASVMMFMGQEVPEVVGIDVDGAWGCPICGIQRIGHIVSALSRHSYDQMAFKDPQAWLKVRTSLIENIKNPPPGPDCTLPLGLFYWLRYEANFGTDTKPPIKFTPVHFTTEFDKILNPPATRDDGVDDICFTDPFVVINYYLMWQPDITGLWVTSLPEGLIELEKVNHIVHLDHLTICAYMLLVIQDTQSFLCQDPVAAQASSDILSKLLDYPTPSNFRTQFKKALLDLYHASQIPLLVRTEIQQSGHTCLWTDHGINKYLAMAGLGQPGQVDGIDADGRFGCNICRVQQLFHSLSATLALGGQNTPFDDPEAWIKERTFLMKNLCDDSGQQCCSLPLGLIYWAWDAVSSIQHAEWLQEFSNSIRNASPLAVIGKYLLWHPKNICEWLSFLPKDAIGIEEIHKIDCLDVLTICAHMMIMTRNRKEFLVHAPQDAQTILNILFQLLDFRELPSKVRSRFTKVLADVCGTSKLYPQYLSLGKFDVRKNGIWVDGGSYGDVWKDKLEGQVVSIKIPRISARDWKDLLSDWSREVIIWSQLSHPNVLPLYGIYYVEHSEASQACMVSPWMDHGNILQFFKSSSSAGVNRLSLVLDIACGIKYLHQCGLVHGDLKAVNILVTPSRRACLMDFGLAALAASQITTSTPYAHLGGTLPWQSPEIINHDTGNSREGDMYAFASVCYEVFTGKTPFCETSNIPELKIMMKVLAGERPDRPGSTELNDTVWSCMQDCWKKKPAERPTADDAVSRISAMPELSGIVRPDEGWDEELGRKLRSSLRNNPLLPSIEQLREMLPNFRPTTPMPVAIDKLEGSN